MYIRFEVRYLEQIKQLNQQIEQWCQKYEVRHAKKVIKQYLRLTFDHDQYYSVFVLTWQGQPFELVNINNY